MPKTWFRVHATGSASILDSRKIQSLPPKLFKWIVNLWAFACANDGCLPSFEDIAWKLHTTVSKVREAVTELVTQRFIDEVDDYFVIHDWSDHQFESDSSTQRVRKFRERQRNVSETPRARAQTQRSDSDTETYTEPDAETNPDGFALAPEEPKPNGKPDYFAEFWGIVWAKIGKGAAENAWKHKVKGNEMAERVIAAAKAQGPGILEHARVHEHSILHPATWLNQGRWDDDPEQVAAPGPVHDYAAERGAARRKRVTEYMEIARGRKVQ